MCKRLIGAGLGAVLTASVTALAVGAAFVQQGWAQQYHPNLSPEDQLAPSQMTQPMPGAVAEPGAPQAPPKPAPKPVPKPPAVHASATPALEPAPKPAPKPPAVHVSATPAPVASEKPGHGAVRTVVECNGPFAKDSGMLALAMVFDSRNMTFTHETVPGGEADVTVLFPNDPRRRLEVWWSNPNRTGTYLIDIAGKSTWTGPHDLRLGLTLEQLEKINRKPFKMKGFGQDDIASVSSWDGGALASLEGGCKAGVNLHSNASAAAAELPAKDEYSSDDPAMRALKPTVTEILIGY
jgi:hypothetical protein